MTLKELRMWHWQRALAERAFQHKMEARLKDRESLKTQDKYNLLYLQHESQRAELTANFHMKAVQALNDVLPGTAEQDCAADLKSNHA